MRSHAPRLARAYAQVLPRPPAPAQISNKLLLKRAPQPTAFPPGATDARAPGAQRPHLGATVRPDHGLWAFFRRTPDDEGNERHQAIEPSFMSGERSVGRPWTASELRRKSFRDLHTLWYVLARERNLIATQLETLRRAVGPEINGSVVHRNRDIRCRKSQARIKLVLNERRLMYEGAAAALGKERAQKLADERASWVAKEKLEVHQQAQAARPEWEEKFDALVVSGELGRVVDNGRVRAIERKLREQREEMEKLEETAAPAKAQVKSRAEMRARRAAARAAELQTKEAEV